MRADYTMIFKKSDVSERKEILCKTCKALFAQTSPRQLYCCTRCRPSGYQKKMKNVNEKVVPCTGCGKLYSKSCNVQKFCTSECRVTSRQIPLKTIDCLECGTSFTQKNWKSIFCSRKCLNTKHNRRSFRVPISLNDEQLQQVVDLIQSFDITWHPKRLA